MNTQREIEQETVELIDLILAHKKEYTQRFLRSNDFHYSGTKEELRDRLIHLISRNEITPQDLTELLDEIEAFGNQHIYLFKIPDSYLERLLDFDSVRRIFEDNNLSELYNNYRPLILPEEPEISSIKHNDEWLSIRWVTKKEKIQQLERTRERDESGREILIKKYLIRKFRATSLFRVSLITGDAELLIYRLPSGSNYNEEKNNYLQQLDGWFDWGVLSHSNLTPIISRIENSGEVRTRNIGLRTSRGSNIDIASYASDKGIYDDPDASAARGSITSGVGNRGNFYWLPENSNGVLTREIHTILYRDRVAITGECREEEVNYVLGRIRSYIQ